MLVGHYAVGFLLKKRFKEIPLWLLFISVQLVDILAFLFVLLGIERIRYNPSENPFLRTIIEYVPFSHSLFFNGIIALLVFLIFWRLKNIVWGLVLFTCVLSHWFIDVIAHVPDMPLFFDKFKVGLGLWHLPWIAFLIELAFLVLAGYFLLKSFEKVGRFVILNLLLIAGFASMFFAPVQEEASSVAAGFVLLLIYTVFTVLAYWVERAKEK